ncbi:MAG TPA: phosphoribosyltransferase family protein, partial [Nitrososphaerales archaeon]|nr:phosphoribosyltransferase family protein [Nitrososphaerales archaeon]
IASRKKPKVVSTLTEEVAGKTVLVVDDLVDEGDTLRTVVKHLSSKNPRSIRTAVLFRKPWSSVTPDYYLETLDEWVVFPWEKGEVERALKKRSPSRLDE